MSDSIPVVTIDSSFGPLTPAEARARAVSFRRLTPNEAREIDAFADALVPGAAEAGVAHFIDDQLCREEPLLFLRYMDYGGGFAEFYREGLKSLERECRARFGQPFSALAAEQKAALVRELSGGNTAARSGPPGPLFYFVLRNDAADLVYGTPAGFARLGIPYRPLLAPSPK